MEKDTKFPRWRFHKDLPDGKIVRSSEENEQLGAGWVDSPLDLVKASAGETKESPHPEAPNVDGESSDQAPTYREHMAKWESKADKQEDKKPSKKSSK